MSQQQWPPPNRSGGSGAGGSVRRARERMEAGLPPSIPAPQAPAARSNESRRVVDNRQRPPMPPGLVNSRNAQGSVGVAISRPTQQPQWPLSGTMKAGGGDPRSHPSYQPPAGRGVAPQRPPRPSVVPSMLDSSRFQGAVPMVYMPEKDRRGQEDSDITSPNLMSPTTQSSRPSTISSVGSIPDFPLPSQPSASVRRSANLGPPPSSRRGGSSYYSQASFVSPIPEESPRMQPSHDSYASSAAIPSSWGEVDSPGSGSTYYDYDEEEFVQYGKPVAVRPFVDRRGESRDSDDSNAGLIRSASFGKRAKPSIVTTRSGERVDGVRPSPVPQQKTGVPLNAGRSREQPRGTQWPVIGNPTSPLATGTGYIESTSSESTVPTLSRISTNNTRNSVTSPGIAKALTTNEPAPRYTAAPMDPGSNAMLDAYAGASSLQTIGAAQMRTSSPGYSRLSAIRRPPKLNMDAVRDAEARGSLTSLPDLIRRATTLAALMDRGKRPGSRLALDDFDNGDFEKDKEMGDYGDAKHPSGLSGMLAAFPPPGVATPDRIGTPNRPTSTWPSYPPGSDQSPNQPPKKPRRCCGLPCWGALILFLVLTLVATAAVVVPLELLVFNKPKSESSTGSSLAALTACSTNTTTACQNGGSSFLDNNKCACICTNGFTGPTCTSTNNTGCTTTILAGNGNQTSATLGNAIARLIAGASNFSIPLSGEVIVARFNSANLSCASENALATLDGRSLRVGKADDVVVADASTTGTNVPTSTSAAPSTRTGPIRNRLRRDAPPTTLSLTYSETKSVSTLSVSKTPTSSPPPAATSSPSPSPPPPSSSPSSSIPRTTTSASLATPFMATERILDFARIAVLYILQQKDLSAAVSAQSTLQRFLSSSASTMTTAAARNITLGQGGMVDLVGFRVDAGDGVVVGGLNSTAVVARSFSGAKLWSIHDDA